MYNTPDHPDIECALRTGYPTKTEFQLIDSCPVCGKNYICGEVVYEIDIGLFSCEDCFVDWAKDFLTTNPKKVADMFNVEHRLYQEVE